MVRITLYDPKISAEVYSQRRAAERSLESPVAEGLGRLGRALMAREDRVEPGNQDRTQALRALAKMRKQELSRLREDLKPGSADPHGSGKRFLQEHTKRRDAFLKALAERNPRSAKLVADRAAALTEDMARRATVFEAANIGDALAADINAALIDAVDTVRADPTQREAMQEEFRATLTALAEEGVDEGALETLFTTANSKIANAAFEGRADEDAEAAREELAAGEFGDGLAEEEIEARVAKADREIKVRQRRSESMARSAEDAFVAEFKGYQRHLLDGGTADQDAFGDEAIRVRVSPETADRLIRERDRAEARGHAFQEIEFLSEEEIEARLAEAEPDEVRHLLWARGHRRQLIRQGSASYVLRDPVVREAFDRWQQATAEGDQAAASAAGEAWANAARALQTRLGIPGSEQRILTTEVAAEMVRDTESPEGPDAAALGAILREQFGEHWQVALSDLERAGLSEQVAIIATLERPDQQPAARQLSAAVGTSTSELRDAAGDAAKFIDQLLGITLGGSQMAPSTQGAGTETSRGELVRRRAYALAAEGWAPGRAVQRALEDLSAVAEPEAGGPDSRSLAALAEIQGIHPSALGDGGPAVETILERLARFAEMTDEERMDLRNDIQELRGGHDAYPALRDRFVDLENAAGLFDPPELRTLPEPAVSPFEASFEEFVTAGDAATPLQVDAIFNRLRGQLIVTRGESGGLNRDWVNDALSGADPQRIEFAARFLAETGSANSLHDVLSETARNGYLDYWTGRFALEDRVQVGPGRPEDSRLATVAGNAHVIPNWVLAPEFVNDLLVEISRSFDATDSQREALIEHIDRVVTPFDHRVGTHLRQAVRSLRIGKDEQGNDDYGEVPARFAYLLSNEQIVNAALSRGIVIPDRSNVSVPVPPPDLLSDPDVINNARSAGFGAVGVGAAVLTGATPIGWVLAGGGALIAGAGLKGSIDDNNDAHTEYLVHLEFYRRREDLAVSGHLSATLDGLGRSDPAGETDTDDAGTPPPHPMRR